MLHAETIPKDSQRQRSNFSLFLPIRAALIARSIQSDFDLNVFIAFDSFFVFQLRTDFAPSFGGAPMECDQARMDREESVRAEDKSTRWTPELLWGMLSIVNSNSDYDPLARRCTS
jgi:hypothetical protein